jgi:hypothetical protein
MSAPMTYLQVVNNVLKRLREPTVITVEDTPYSSMLGVFVNDAKREVEDAHDWNVLSHTITATTQQGIYNYTLTDAGTRFRIIDVLNDTQDVEVRYAPTKWMNKQFLLAEAQQSAPVYYNCNGVDANNDTQVDVFPIPDKEYALRFNLIIPQAELTQDSTKILVPGHLVVKTVVTCPLKLTLCTRWRYPMRLPLSVIVTTMKWFGILPDG